MTTPLALPPLSLYIHIPWCIRKCPYCDFNSHAAGAALPEDEYVEALLADLTHEVEHAQGRRLHSIFFGGGTPSLFSARAIARILDGAEQALGFADDIEITLEANPGTFEQNKFRGFRTAGVNRLSIGVQSFQTAQLKALGRIHDGDDARRAIDRSRAAGFERFNLDLMHGLPGQDLAGALADLDQALAFEPPHLSWYQLTIEPNTAFHSNPPVLPHDDILGDIQDAGGERLARAGLTRYEVSAFAQQGEESRHNRNYWQFGDYLGIGAGAHGKITVPERDAIVRRSKTRLPRDYLARSDDRCASEHEVTSKERTLEFLMNALRLIDGVPKAMFAERTGLDFAAVAPWWQTQVTRGLLAPPDRRLAATALGIRFLDTVLSEWLQ